MRGELEIIFYNDQDALQEVAMWIHLPVDDDDVIAEQVVDLIMKETEGQPSLLGGEARLMIAEVEAVYDFSFTFDSDGMLRSQCQTMH